MEGGGGVVHRHDGATTDLPRLAVNAADALAGDEFVERVAPQRNDHQGVYGGDLAVEVGIAGADLAGFRVAVVRRAALDDVGNEDLLPAHADGAEQAFEELTGGANERPALLVFVEAGGFADEQQGAVGVALTGYGVRAALVQRAFFARGNLCADGFKLLDACLPWSCVHLGSPSLGGFTSRTQTGWWAPHMGLVVGGRASPPEPPESTDVGAGGSDGWRTYLLATFPGREGEWRPRAGRGSGGVGGSPYTRWSKTAGGAELGWQDALDWWWSGVAGR